MEQGTRPARREGKMCESVMPEPRPGLMDADPVGVSTSST
jgi:hypothetical protein